jgi:hypothetical protein
MLKVEYQWYNLKHMFILGLLGWWYGSGWKKVGAILMQRAVVAEDYFSIDLLLKTLFSPFRQISADTGRGGTLGDKMRAAFDKLFSRVIGAAVRIILILVGTAWLLINLVIDIAILVVWPLLPLFPLIGLILSFGGFLPWKQ